MSTCHVLGASGKDTYTIVVHALTPIGNNSAGIAWNTVLVNSGLAKTIMLVGTGPGLITTVEKAAVEAGTTLEGVFQFQDDLALTGPQRLTALDAVAAQVISELQARIAARYKYFGLERT